MKRTGELVEGNTTRQQKWSILCWALWWLTQNSHFSTLNILGVTVCHSHVLTPSVRQICRLLSSFFLIWLLHTYKYQPHSFLSLPTTQRKLFVIYLKTLSDAEW